MKKMEFREGGMPSVGVRQKSRTQSRVKGGVSERRGVHFSACALSSNKKFKKKEYYVHVKRLASISVRC